MGDIYQLIPELQLKGFQGVNTKEFLELEIKEVTTLTMRKKEEEKKKRRKKLEKIVVWENEVTFREFSKYSNDVP